MCVCVCARVLIFCVLTKINTVVAKDVQHRDLVLITVRTSKARGRSERVFDNNPHFRAVQRQQDLGRTALWENLWQLFIIEKKIPLDSTQA